ncbi:hypothetical protein [Luteimonas sp. A482]
MSQPDETAGGRRLLPRFLSLGGRSASERRLPASTPVTELPRILQLAIDGARFVAREPDDDGERIAVFCNELGGAWIYDRAEAVRRIQKRFPELSDDATAVAARYLENHLRAHLREVTRPAHKPKSGLTHWAQGWATRQDYQA